MAVFHKTKCLTDTRLHYCPGCTHGIVHRLIAESVEELGMAADTIGVSPVGCAVFADKYFNFDMIEAAHGRAPAVATGIKRAKPNKLVFTYQGDGDLASIGMAETVHSAARNENITIIFINNGIYGMTGGQMAPTTLMGAKATTCVNGRAPINGYPIKVSEMLSTLEGPRFIARVSTHDVKNVINAKKVIKKALNNQLEGKGFSLVEVLTTCPTNWGITPVQASEYVRDKAIPFYPLGTYKEVE